MWPNPQETADLVTFTEEILNGKLWLLCSSVKIHLAPLNHMLNELDFKKLKSLGQWLNTTAINYVFLLQSHNFRKQCSTLF